jgi:hypothetical protein
MSKSMVLRVCRADMSSHNGFIWPTAGHVVAPDWKATKKWGNGLHGWFEGQGYAGCSDYHSEADAKYLVLEVETDSIVHLEGKCKFPEADVVFVGNRSEVMTYIAEFYPQLRAMPLLFANRTAGDYGTATAGDYGIATAGKNGTATAGENGTATAGDYGTATAGENGTATAGYRGTATAGVEGVIQIHYFNGRVRFVTGYIGEQGLAPNVKYKLDINHNFVEVT